MPIDRIGKLYIHFNPSGLRLKTCFSIDPSRRKITTDSVPSHCKLLYFEEY